MIHTHILLRYGELFLKGKNKELFEKRLINNIKKLAHTGEVKKIRGRLIVDYFNDHERLKKVFGLVSYSPAIRVEKNLEEIKKEASRLLNNKKIKTFKIETKRSDKQFLIKSPEMNVKVGEFIEESSRLKFSFKNPEKILKIEINQEGAYLFTETVKCFGGLPTGIEGKVNLLVENSASILAGLLFMKRGCSVVPVFLNGKEDISLLQKFSPEKIELRKIKNLNELTERILVSGQNFEKYNELDVKLMVFRPLISYSGEEIGEKLDEFRQ